MASRVRGALRHRGLRRQPEPLARDLAESRLGGEECARRRHLVDAVLSAWPPSCHRLERLCDEVLGTEPTWQYVEEQGQRPHWWCRNTRWSRHERADGKETANGAAVGRVCPTTSFWPTSHGSAATSSAASSSRRPAATLSVNPFKNFYRTHPHILFFMCGIYLIVLLSQMPS